MREVINLYSSLKEEDESPEPTSAAATQRIVQDSILGNYAPLGPDSDAPPRSSTRAANASTIGLNNLAPRNVDGGVVVDISPDKDEDYVEIVTNNSSKKKKCTKDEKGTPKKPKKVYNIESIINANDESRKV